MRQCGSPLAVTGLSPVGKMIGPDRAQNLCSDPAGKPACASPGRLCQRDVRGSVTRRAKAGREDLVVACQELDLTIYARVPTEIAERDDQHACHGRRL